MKAVPDPTEPPTAPINQWLSPLTFIAISRGIKDLQVLVEENVRQQVRKLSTVVAKQSKPVKVHGWVYDLDLGTLRDLRIAA